MTRKNQPENPQFSPDEEETTAMHSGRGTVPSAT